MFTKQALIKTLEKRPAQFAFFDNDSASFLNILGIGKIRKVKNWLGITDINWLRIHSSSFIASYADNSFPPTKNKHFSN